MAKLGSGVRMKQLADLVAQSVPDRCTIWPYGKKAGQYGVVWRNGANVYAHRVAYELAGHKLLPTDVLRHDCDTPACMNPFHLTPGTTADNVADRVKRGRGACGERHHRAKLTAADVHQIRSSQLSNRRLGVMHGVSGVMIGNIKRGLNWKHL